MSPDDRRFADHEPTGFFLLAARHSHEFLSAYSGKRSATVCTAAASDGPNVAEYRLGAATVRPSSDLSSQGAGRTSRCDADSSSDFDHTDSGTTRSEKLGDLRKD